MCDVKELSLIASKNSQWIGRSRRQWMNGLADHPSEVLGIVAKANRNVEVLSICGSSVGMPTARDLRMGYRAADGLSSDGDLSESERIVVVRTVDGDTDRSL
jgi:hypothetical protein